MAVYAAEKKSLLFFNSICVQSRVAQSDKELAFLPFAALHSGVVQYAMPLSEVVDPPGRVAW